jgi:hypothetical protein
MDSKKLKINYMLEKINSLVINLIKNKLLRKVLWKNLEDLINVSDSFGEFYIFNILFFYRYFSEEIVIYYYFFIHIFY